MAALTCMGWPMTQETTAICGQAAAGPRWIAHPLEPDCFATTEGFDASLSQEAHDSAVIDAEFIRNCPDRPKSVTVQPLQDMVDWPSIDVLDAFPNARHFASDSGLWKARQYPTGLQAMDFACDLAMGAVQLGGKIVSSVRPVV